MTSMPTRSETDSRPTCGVLPNDEPAATLRIPGFLAEFERRLAATPGLSE